MRIYVTGGTGYIGRALCRQLAAEGHEIRALVRSEERGRPLAELGAALFPGDVTDRASMREGMSGCELVIHAAADLDPFGPRERMEAVNVGGSENVASLAWKLGVRRLLSVSSIAYFGGSPEDGAPGTEESPVRKPFPTAYSETKHRGERAIRAWAEQGLGVVTVYPSLVYGPPGKKEGANALLRLLWLGRFPVLVGADRRSSWVFLDDLVEGIARVVERWPVGAAYLMAGDTVSVRELARRVAELGGAPVPEREISVRTARLISALIGPFYRLRGRRSPLPSAQLASLARHWAFDDARARRELGWSPRGLEQGLPAALEHIAAGERTRGPAVD